MSEKGGRDSPLPWDVEVDLFSFFVLHFQWLRPFCLSKREKKRTCGKLGKISGSSQARGRLYCEDQMEEGVWWELSGVQVRLFEGFLNFWGAMIEELDWQSRLVCCPVCSAHSVLLVPSTLTSSDRSLLHPSKRPLDKAQSLDLAQRSLGSETALSACLSAPECHSRRKG